MKVKKSVFIFSLGLFFISLYMLPAQAIPNSVDMLDLHVQPTSIKVGDTFAINATIVNNYNNTISIHNGCGGPFSVVFDNHAKVEVKKVCNFMAIQIILKPGANVTLTSLASNLDYKAQTAGMTNANVTISYTLANQTGTNMTFSGKTYSISKPLVFSISGASATVQSPLQQLRSGIAAKDVICQSGFQLVFKIEDNSPACVTHDTSTRLFDMGWAKSSSS
jgi:hypothetical protein